MEFKHIPILKQPQSVSFHIAESLLSLKKSQLLSLVDQQIIQPTTTSGGISRADDGQYLDKEMAAFQVRETHI